MTLNAEDTFKQYEQHLRAVDAEFRRVYQLFADRMQCRRGCSMCCSQMFSISLIEAAYISRAVKKLPEAERERLQAAARSYIAQAKKLTGADESDGEESITPRPGLRLPCPALRGDACTIYNARPIICRKWGIPLFNPKRPTELQACELNFRAGEEVDVDGLLEPQVALLEDWVELKGRARRSLNYPKRTATIAEAIAFDYEEILLSRAQDEQ
ncbi:MAG TPA: YkgJ family cysteine cluster protein [Blastocatellia bacterium]|jgi:Fe-S-cluster containining protein|nr:YkgJ family cysteine cluster protein [Blastocatellia bacterium]